ncbi:MAG: hypothetical protein KAR47_02930 [Planctomycetes bacterium]|nr:hypothetical protein [Planctomycetota bacterium]
MKKNASNNTAENNIAEPGLHPIRYFLLISIALVVAILLLVGLRQRTASRNLIVSEAEKDAVKVSKLLSNCQSYQLLERAAKTVDTDTSTGAERHLGEEIAESEPDEAKPEYTEEPAKVAP